MGTAGGIFLVLTVTLFGAKSLIVNQLIFVAAIPMSCLMDASLAIDLSDTLWPSPTSSAC